MCQSREAREGTAPLRGGWINAQVTQMAGNENQSKWSQLFYELIARSFIFQSRREKGGG